MTTPSEPTPAENPFLVLPPNPRDVCTCNHPRSTHGEQREGPYCWGVLRTEEPVCECPGFAFKRLTRLEQIRWEHERAAHWDPGFSALTETGVLLAEIDRLTAELDRLTAELAARDRLCACNADEKWMHDTTCPRGALAWDGTDWQANGYYADADGFVWNLCSVLPSGEPLFAPLAGDMDVAMPLSDVLDEGGPLTRCPRPDDQPDQN